MNRQTLKLALLAILFGLAVGILLPRLMKEEWHEWFEEKEPAITLPEGELKTDAFSLRLLQTALQLPEYPLPFVSPAAVTEALHHLETISTGATQEQIRGLNLCAPGKEAETSVVLAAMDDALPPAENARPILPLPFRSNYPEAVSTFNTLFGFAAADSANTSPETRLFMAARTELPLIFRQPFYAEDGKNADFDNDNGSLPAVPMLRRCGQFRIAEAEDGSWKAVALLVKDYSFGGDGDSSAFVAVLPQGKARTFALQLTPEQLSHIRRALAQAPLRPCTVELPKMSFSVFNNNCNLLLRELGVTAPFDIRTADFSPVTTERIALNALAESLSCRMAVETHRPSHISPADSSPDTFSLNRPFLWFVGDLTTEAPFIVMGVVENL